MKLFSLENQSKQFGSILKITLDHFIIFDTFVLKKEKKEKEEKKGCLHIQNNSSMKIYILFLCRKELYRNLIPS